MYFKKDVGNLNSVGQFIELYKQVNNAIKKQGADPDQTAKDLINDNILGLAVENYLVSKKQQEVPKIPTEPVYFKPRPGLLPVSGTTGVYNEKKHSKLFNGGIYNNTGENLDVVTTGTGETPAGKILVNDLIKDGMYREFIKNAPENFFNGLEHALQAVHDNPALVQEVMKQDRRIHVPFTNASGARFVAYVCECVGELSVSVYELSIDGVWIASSGDMVLFPQQEPLKN